MAGHGSRFAMAGYADPKPLITIGGRPMIQWVIDNIRPSQPHHFIFVCLREHLLRFPQLRQQLEALCPGCAIISTDRVTEGAACTVLLARELIDTDSPLMIANSDQLVDLPIDDYLRKLETENASGLIMTFWADDPKWSYCRLRANGTVAEVVEKQVISNDATVGIYNFAHGSDFVAVADEMIMRNLRVNGEFYVAPVYNILIERGARVVTAAIASEGVGMHGLGTPVDLQHFLQTEMFRRLSALQL